MFQEQVPRTGLEDSSKFLHGSGQRRPRTIREQTWSSDSKFLHPAHKQPSAILPAQRELHAVGSQVDLQQFLTFPRKVSALSTQVSPLHSQLQHPSPRCRARVGSVIPSANWSRVCLFFFLILHCCVYNFPLNVIVSLSLKTV